MKRKTVLISFVVLLVLFLGYQYINQEHRNIGEEKAVLTIESSKFYQNYKENAVAFNKNYIDKTVRIKGIVTSLDQNAVVLDSTCYIKLNDTIINIKKHDQITVKGRYVGFDDLLEQVKIDQAIIEND